MEEFLGDTSVEAALGAFNELYGKYKYMEKSLESSKSVYKSKLPETQQTLELVEAMKKKGEDDEEMIVDYSLCDTIYAKAKVSTEDQKVYLWIGAQTMVEYSYDEALELLNTQVMDNNYHIKISFRSLSLNVTLCETCTAYPMSTEDRRA